MRILFLSRLHPSKRLGPLESRLHDRLTELSELGHEVLILTKWTGEPVDFELPSRIEIRSPFKTFRPWEWTGALPMVFAWRPDVLHVFDPGLSKIERSFSVEMIAMTMLEAMSRASRGRSPYRGSLVSLAAGASDDAETGWKRAGAEVVESGWLRSVGAEKAMKPWDRASDRNLRIVLAGIIGGNHPAEHPFEHVLDALQVMRHVTEFELTVFLDRTRLSSRDRRRLAHAERMLSFGDETPHAVGSRLHVLQPREATEMSIDADAAIVAGLNPAQARIWIERLEMPVVLSECQSAILAELERIGMSAQVLGAPVTDVAPIAQALHRVVDRDLLKTAWHKIEQGELAGGRDVAANHLSRIYSQIAGTASNSYS